MSMQSFIESAVAFNRMYRLPISVTPVLSWAQATEFPTKSESETISSSQVQEDWARQVNNFLTILGKEVNEIGDIMDMFESDDEDIDQLDILTAIADWLGDVVVYCATEATKYGVTSYIPNHLFCDHAAYSNIYADMEQMESAMVAIRDVTYDTVNYHRDLLIGQPSVKNMANFLNAMISRCFHEAEHFGFDLYDILEIIMDSNASKLDDDGNPIYDENFKVLKGPNYWKPEPLIREYLEELFVLDDEDEENTESDEDADDEDDEQVEIDSTDDADEPRH